MNFMVWTPLLVIGVLESMTGIILNTVIVAVNISVVKTNLRPNPSHQLTIIMGLVNVLLLCMFIIQALFYMMWLPIFLSREVVSFFMVAAACLLYFSYWLTTWLCVYYFVSVTHFNQWIFVCLKRIFSSLLPYLLVLSGLGSFVLSVMSLWDSKVLVQTNDNVTLDITISTISSSFSLLYRMLCSVLGCWFPFTLTSISIGFMLSSILRHLRRLRQNSFGFTSPQLQAHINVIRTMILLFLLCVASYLVSIFGFLIDFSSDDVFLLNLMFVVSFPTIEAIILIQASSKLKKIFLPQCLMVDTNHDGSPNGDA